MAKIEITPSFSSVLRDARKSVGLSREQVAHVACVDPSYLARCEKGLVEPTFSRAVAMLRAAGAQLSAERRGNYGLVRSRFDFARGFEFDPSTYSENPDGE